MTAAGVVAVDIFGLILLVWVLNLVMLGRLYVGYAALFVGLIVFGGAAVSLPPLRHVLVSTIRFFFPDGGAAVLALALVLFLLIYIFTQMTILSNRLSAVVQDLAISRARDSESAGAPAAVEARERRR
jgi:hypothetical protein